VLSWDGYLWAIFRRPLLSDQFHGVISLIRFTIDIYLVLIYMILMITIGRLTWWLPIIFVVYVFYIVWDFFTAVEYPERHRQVDAVPVPSLRSIYWAGLSDSTTISRGPVVTIAWAVYFGCLFYLSRAVVAEHVLVTALFAVLGLALYRIDKSGPFRMVWRFSMIAALLVANFAYTRFLPWLDDPYLGSVLRLARPLFCS
jgi:hypothetical protein